MVIENFALGLGVNLSDIPKTLSITGNLVSSSIPFLISQNFKKFTNSDILVLSGFGVGLSMSSCIIKNAL